MPTAEIPVVLDLGGQPSFTVAPGPTEISIDFSFGSDSSIIAGGSGIKPSDNDPNGGIRIKVEMGGSPELFWPKPPAQYQPVPIKRLSVTYPPPGAKAPNRGWPDPETWQPTVLAENDLYATFQVVVDGKDITAFRDAPMPMPRWTSQEPFGDAIATLHVPGISPFEQHGKPNIPWLWTGALMNIYMWIGTTRKTLFDGFVWTWKPAQDFTGLEVMCPGILWDAETHVQKPYFLKAERDTGLVITQYMNELGNTRFAKMKKQKTGVISWSRGAFQNNLLTSGIQPLLTDSWISTTQQWTLTNVGRKPVLKLKDRTTKHWTFTFGGHGVDAGDLARSPGPNAIYGEGTDPEGRWWRNSKWPNWRPEDVPIFPSGVSNFSPGDGEAGFDEFADQLRALGYRMYSKNTYLAKDEPTVKRFQADKGILANGHVAGQSWNAAFNAGLQGDALDGAYIGTLYISPSVAQWLHDADGAVTGPNPLHNPKTMRIERHNNYGSNSFKKEAMESARLEVIRGNLPDRYAGDMTVAVDPEEGSRYEMKAGENVFLRYLWDDTTDDDGAMLHMAQADHDAESSRLTVSGNALDFVTMSQILDQKRDNSDPGRIPGTTKRRSKTTIDNLVVWDSENGSGIIPRHGLYGGLFSVIKVPAGEEGTIVESYFKTRNPITRFMVLIFDRPVTSNWLHKILGARHAPLTNDTLVTKADVLKERGLKASWGGNGNNFGYYPGFQDKGHSMTGVGFDDGQWSYASEYPPWIWVAELAQVSTYISGRLKSGVVI